MLIWPEKPSTQWNGITWFVNHKEMKLKDSRDFSPTGDRFTATDEATGKHYRIRRASCGLPCRCAAAVVKEIK